MALKAALLVMALALPAAAQAGDKGMGVPPSPKDTSDAGVKAWVKRYIDDDGWTVVVSDETRAILVSPDAMEFTRNDTLKFWYRAENLQPDIRDGKAIRSMNILQEIDCKDERMRLLAVDAYGLNSLQGEKLSTEDDPDAKWAFSRPGTNGQILGAAICGYIDHLAEDAAAKDTEKVGVKGHF